MIVRASSRNILRSRRRLPVSSVRELDVDAPIPTYELDKVLTGPLFRTVMSDRAIRLFRLSANFAAQMSIHATREHFETPADIASAAMLLDSLLQIDRLIGQIQKVDVAKIARLIRPSNKNLSRLKAIRVSRSAVESLQSSLQKIKARIEIFTRQHSVVKPAKGNNRDPFTAHFIWHFGRRLGFGSDFGVNIPPFAKVLAAAWRDLNLPLEDHRGRSREPLERWFSDRLRHFTSPEDEAL